MAASPDLSGNFSLRLEGGGGGFREHRRGAAQRAKHLQAFVYSGILAALQVTVERQGNSVLSQTHDLGLPWISRTSHFSSLSLHVLTCHTALGVWSCEDRCVSTAWKILSRECALSKHSYFPSFKDYMMKSPLCTGEKSIAAEC